MGRRAIVLLVALILAGLAAWAVWNYLQNVEGEILEGQEIVEVYVAGETIVEGTDGTILLSDFNSGGELIVLDQDQAEDVPEGAITTAEQLNQVLTSRVAAGPIAAGSILTESQWVSVTVDITPLAEEIPSGKQAMTISVDNIRGINGFVEPGDRINMLITLDIGFDLLPSDFSGVTVEPGTDGTEGETPAGEAEQTVVTYTRFVLQGLPVMATGRDIRPDENAPDTVDVETTPSTTPDGQPVEPVEEEIGRDTIFTLEVTPEQAERIAYAVENGSIWLTLVPGDFVEVETSGVIIDNLFGGDLVEDIFG
ncbi:MAG: Flp pilus assembly protein CpaB [Actinomycetota bacterium]|nr:Flp pilus assembly protein CpaB [Actinomycetota bacterium]